MAQVASACGAVAFALGALAFVFYAGKARGRRELARDIKTNQQASLLYAARDAATPFDPSLN